MINMENVEKIIVKENEQMNPFNSVSVYSILVAEGTCRLIYQKNSISKLLDTLEKNAMIFRNEFDTIELENIFLEACQPSLLCPLTVEQVDSISNNNLNKSIARIHTIHTLFSTNEESILISPVSKNGQKALNGNFEVVVKQFPFQVGRYNSKKMKFLSMKNDLNLFDKKPYQISRVHFRIEKRGNDFYFRDMNSKLGSWVNDIQLAKHSGFETKLKKGYNQILLGKKSSEIILSMFVKN